MKLTVEELQQRNAVLLDKLPHDGIIPFVQKYLKQQTVATRFYVVVNIFLVALIITLLFLSDVSVADNLGSLGFGVFATLLLIPLHEYIHGIAYRILGARNVSYHAEIKKFVFYAMADKFIVNSGEFLFVALLPFTVINSLLIVATVVAPATYMFTFLGMLLFHTAACSGDFGLVSYLQVHSDKSIVTYDDQQYKESYFFDLGESPRK